jgi:hypothetical protein
MFLKQGLGKQQTNSIHHGTARTTRIDPGLRQAITEQIGSGNATNIQNDESKPPVYEIEYNGEIYTSKWRLGKPRIWNCRVTLTHGRREATSYLRGYQKR